MPLPSTATKPPNSMLRDFFRVIFSGPTTILLTLLLLAALVLIFTNVFDFT